MAEKTKTDELLEKTLEHLGKLDARLDAIEEEKKADKAKKDAEAEEESAKGKARKDAEEKAEKEKADAARKDAEDQEAKGRFAKQDGEMPEAFKKRADAEEEKLAGEFEKKGEAKEVAADRAKKARRDAEEMMDKKDAEEKAKEDAAKADAAALLAGTSAESIIAMQAKIKELQAMIPRSVSDQDHGALLAAQARADEYYGLHGLQAPRALNGETVSAYRRRLARELQKHSGRWKDTDLLKLDDDKTFAVVEEQIYADSAVAAAHPTDLAEGTLRPVTKRMPSGHTVTEFYGTPNAWMGKFSGPVRNRVTRFKTGDAA